MTKTINQEIFDALNGGKITPAEVRKILTTFSFLGQLGLKVPTVGVSALADAASRVVYQNHSEEPQRTDLASKLDKFKVENPAETSGQDWWNNKIPIIKNLRTEFGLGLYHAKILSEALYPEADKFRIKPPAVDENVSDRMKAILSMIGTTKGINYNSLVIFYKDMGPDCDPTKLIERLKECRYRFGFDLRSAKEIVKSIWHPNG